MELYRQFKLNGYFTCDIYHFLAKKKVVMIREDIIPSVYKKEIAMSTAERLKMLPGMEVENRVSDLCKGGELCKGGDLCKAGDVKLVFNPPVIIFQNFKGGEKVTTKFSVQNKSHASVFVTMCFEESSYFLIKSCGPDLLSRLAPGMCCSFTLTFMPARFEDYVHKVTFKTKNEVYAVPIIAMGPRPSLELPDNINFGTVPIKINKNYKIEIVNTGAVPVSFSLRTRTPFSVEPKSVRLLAPNSDIDVTVTLKTMYVTESEGTLNVELETGENFVIKLRGSTFTVSVKIEREVIRFDDTFNTMVRQETFKIINKSDYVLTYMCMKNKNVLDDFEDKVAIATVWYDFKNTESVKCAKLAYYDVLNSEEHQRVYTRIFSDEIQALVADDSLKFQNMHFSITPIKGKLWPNQATEITVTFHPKEIGEFETTAYVDIDGVSERAPIRMTGTSLPPKIVLSLENLDIDEVFINKTYQYEIIATNRGHINGVVVYKPTPTLFYSKISCNPEMACLRPLEKQVFVISFSNSNQGSFFEEINFLIRDTQVVLKVYLRGIIIYPSITFDIPCVNFENVSIGIPETIEFSVINESEVNVRGFVKISTDGPEISSVKLEDCAVNETLSEIPKWPREFNIVPNIVEIGPRSSTTIKVTLVANLVRVNSTMLELELEKSDSPPVTLPVSYSANVPSITPAPDINMRSCFINYTYEHKIIVTAHDYFGYFVIEELKDDPAFRIEVGKTRGLFGPNTILKLSIKITMVEYGVHTCSIRMKLFGLRTPIDICRITGNCVRPILACHPLALHWGQVKLLIPTYKTLTIINDSPCAVNYTTTLLRPDDMWTIIPPKGVLGPEQETDITVSLCVSDADVYTNKAILQFENIRDITVPLSATGVGTSIVVGELIDRIVLGKHYTKLRMECIVPIKNCGTKFHSLEWNEFIKAPKVKPTTVPFFHLEPKTFQLGPGEIMDLVITATSSKVTTVKETWYLHGSVEGINRKELLLECPVEAEFIEAKIELSSNFMTFRSDYGPYSEFYKITDILTIENVSKLPLDIDIKIKHPFLMIQKRDTYKIMPSESKTCCCIYYDEDDLNLANLKKSSGDRLPPIYIDFVTLKPVPPLRNRSLQFFEDVNKIKQAFSVTQSVEERLEPQDVMKIQIIFDTSKHSSLKSKVYTCLLRIKFKGHKNKDVVKLVGSINFPNVLVLTPKIDFKCIQNGAIGSECIILQNATPLLVCYRFRWRKFCVTSIPEPKIEESVSDIDVMEIVDASPVLSESKTSEGMSGEEIVAVKEEVTSNEVSYLDKVGIESKELEEVIDDLEILEKKTMRLLLPMIRNENQTADLMWTEKLPTLSSKTSTNINEYFQLTPHRGFLKPAEIQTIHIIFKPKYNVSVKATLECEVLGGPSEFISVSGMSSSLVYKLSTQRLNFKIRHFNEDATENILLSNIALLEFDFKIYLNEPKNETELDGLINDIRPLKNTLLAEEEVEIDVYMRPGVMGFFHRQFILEIGYLPHLTIDIVGWGVVPQIYITWANNNSPNFRFQYLQSIEPIFGYEAISNLTCDYLDAIDEIFADNFTPTFESLPNLYFRDGLFDESWYIISQMDRYPKRMDIDLAVERLRIIKHLQLHPYIVREYRTGSRKGSIPDFSSFPYVVDFGIVMNGSTVSCNLNITNYGPVATKPYLGNSCIIPDWLSLKLCGKINPGDVGSFEITLESDATYFPELEQDVRADFVLEVPYSARIPIQVKALCAVPYLKTSVELVDFGAVKCGNKVIKSIPLRNIGKPTCIWHVVLKMNTPGPNPITVFDGSGNFEPGEGGWLRIAFRPTMNMLYQGTLIFKFHMNPVKLTIPVVGQGVMPQVHVIGPNIRFPPTLPWAQTSEIYFGVTNSSPFPIELIVFHADKKWAEEEELYKFLHMYYNKPDEMLVPTIKPGDDWPSPIKNLFKKFQSDIKRFKNEDQDNAKKESAKHTKKQTSKSPKNVPQPKEDIVKQPQKQKTEAEIIQSVIDSYKKEGLDPLKECTANMFKPENVIPKAPEIPRGLLIFMHGSPFEECDCQQMAYALGKALRLPTINLDMCLVDALYSCQTTESELILSTLNDFYHAMHKLLVDSQLDVLSEEDDQESFDAIKTKLDFYIKYQGFGDTKKKTAPSGSASTGKGSALTSMFDMDHLDLLLTEYFSLPQFRKGFVVCSLSSNIIYSPHLVLKTLLRCKSTIVNAHLVLCESNYAKWLQEMEAKAQEAELLEAEKTKEYTEEVIEDIIEMCEEMDADEYENAPEEYKTIYVQARRQKLQDKKAAKNRFKRQLRGNSRSSNFTSKISQDVNSAAKDKSPSKKEEKGKVYPPEYSVVCSRYNEYYKNVHDNLISIAINWDFNKMDVATPILNITGKYSVTTGKKPLKKNEASMMEVKDYENKGFPLTLLTCACLKYKEALVNMFLSSPIVQAALSKPPPFNILECPVIDEKYTVLMPKTAPIIVEEPSLTFQFLEEFPIKKCDCNQYSEITYIDDSTPESVINVLSKWHCTCGKKLKTTQTSTTDFPSTLSDRKDKSDYSSEEDFYVQPLPLNSVLSNKDYPNRMVLEPGDLVRFKYLFAPKQEGQFNLKRYFEAAGWPDSRVEINVSAICDIPRLDSRPKKMFANFARRMLEDKVYKTTFLDDRNVFEFGAIFIGPNRVYEEDYMIDLKNSSLLRVEIETDFQEMSDFNVNKKYLTIEPGEKDKLGISAAPATIGVHNTTLLLCIKNNPEMVSINITCTGVVPIVDVLPENKIIDYGKHLLYRRQNDRFIIKNDSILPIMWKIRNPEDFAEQFLIDKLSGIIPRNDNQVVPIIYIACKVNVISNLSLIIDVYDEKGRGSPMITEELFLSAECYDVMVICMYENPTENALNFGNVKVNSSAYKEMYFFNRGKYNVYYKLKKVKKFPQPPLLKSLLSSSDYGLIAATPKPIPVGFQCTPVTAMKLVSVPAYICTIVDATTDQVVVARFPILLSIFSYYNTLTIHPKDELNFHIIPVGATVEKQIILTNTSVGPFIYEIVPPPQYRNTEVVVQGQKGKDTKMKFPPIPCGNFIIVNEDNLLEAGATRVISVQFTATEAATSEDVIRIVVSDTAPEQANGVPMRLIGTGSIPKLDFWNTAITFKEHVILKHLSDYRGGVASPHSVFIEDSTTFHFFCVTVNTKYTASIHLYNDGLVPCLLTMNLLQKATDNAFKLDKYDMQVEPLMSNKLPITFCPKKLQEYRAVLEINLKISSTQEESFKLCLAGEGVIPRIHILQPPVKYHRMGLLKFPLTCLGTTNRKIIRFKNTSVMKSKVFLQITQPSYDTRPAFWLNTVDESVDMIIKAAKDDFNTRLTFLVLPGVVVKTEVCFCPSKKGKTNCDVNIDIKDNPFERYTILCEAEAFMEDVLLMGLEMLPMDIDIDGYKASSEGVSVMSSADRKKVKSASVEKSKKHTDSKKSKRQSLASSSKPASDSTTYDETVEIKYELDFGGCELCAMQKRSVIMINNSEKVYKFAWTVVENIVVKPALGYISPGEEKDLEITFFSAEPIDIKKEEFCCKLTGVNDENLVIQGPTWDSRQTVTHLSCIQDYSLMEKCDVRLDEQDVTHSAEVVAVIYIHVYYSAVTEFTKYTTTLPEKIHLQDTFIYKSKTFEFKVDNVGNVPMKITWKFSIDDEYPCVINKHLKNNEPTTTAAVESDISTSEQLLSADLTNQLPSVPPDNSEDNTKESLFSCSLDRTSVDTWFEVDLPFKVEPCQECIKPKGSAKFKIIFNPVEPFQFKVRLKSTIDNLDPYDQNISCKITAKSLIPYVHLTIDESDYLVSDRRVPQVIVPPTALVLEFNVIGAGCFKKSFNIINPTVEAYEYFFEPVFNSAIKGTTPIMVPVHCSKVRGFVEGGTSVPVTFTFNSTSPGVYESHWRFVITAHSIVMDLLIVGIVREPIIHFNPPLLICTNYLVGHCSNSKFSMVNCESQNLKFEYKGSSLGDESSIVVVTPEKGVLSLHSETQFTLYYTPKETGVLCFKIFMEVEHVQNPSVLCVKIVSDSISPFVTYRFMGNDYELKSDTINEISLKKTASAYERKITFKIKNDGTKKFSYEWEYMVEPVKRFLKVSVEPRTGSVSAGNEHECILHFTLTQVPVVAYPVTLKVKDGAQYKIHLHADIDKPIYHFSKKAIDFGKCIVNAPEGTYKKCMGFTNNDHHTILLNLDFISVPELFVDFKENVVAQNVRQKIPIFFQPKEVKTYEWRLKFWVNTMCEEIITVRGEGVPLLFDLHEGCQKSFNLGPVRVGTKIVRVIEVVNHSKVQVTASFFFTYDLEENETGGNDIDSEGTSICLGPNEPEEIGPSRNQLLKQYTENKKTAQIKMDLNNTLDSLKVFPTKYTFKPHQKIPLKIHLKPVGMISRLHVQLNAKIFNIVVPLVALYGSATDMSLELSNSYLLFGLVRRNGFKVKKVTLINKGDFPATFTWLPIESDEFKITPVSGVIKNNSKIIFSVIFKPTRVNPFIKTIAMCDIENYKQLKLSLYAICLETGVMQLKNLNMECPVREKTTEMITIANQSDDLWHAVSEWNEPEGVPFETIKEFTVMANSTIEIPITFKPQTMGSHEAHVLYSNLGESSLYYTVIGIATEPNPNSVIEFMVEAKKIHTEILTVYNITGFPEWYLVSSEVVSVTPANFDGYYEIKQPERLKLWGEAKGTITWNFTCYEPCEMQLKVIMTNAETKEYQYYNILATVTPSEVVDVLSFTCHARETVQQEVVVRNPLAEEVLFQISTQKLSCESVLKVPRNSQTMLNLVYAPTVVEECEDEVVITNDRTGTYVYKALLKCLPGKIKEVECSTPLGTRKSVRLRVQNRSEFPVEFTCSVSHPSIILDKNYYPLGPSEKKKFMVWFEPTELGVQRCTVVFTSPIAGEFVFEIKGTGTEPTPRGPYDIKAGSNADGFALIRFRNIFDKSASFKVNVDNPIFYVKTSLLDMTMKSETEITVFQNDSSSKLRRSTPPTHNAPKGPTGVLSIEYVDNPKIHWNYFLQGI